MNRLQEIWTGKSLLDRTTIIGSCSDSIEKLWRREEPLSVDDIIALSEMIFEMDRQINGMIDNLGGFKKSLNVVPKSDEE